MSENVRKGHPRFRIKSVLLAIAEGKPDEQIAREIGVSVEMFHHLLRRVVYPNLGVEPGRNSRANAVHLAYQRGILRVSTSRERLLDQLRQDRENAG